MWLGPRAAGGSGRSSCTALRSGGFSSLGLKDRRTDGPCIPFSLGFQAPHGLSASVMLGSCRRYGHRPQILGSAWALLPHPHTSIYVQGHTDTDTYKYTQACTHAHKYTHAHQHVPFHSQPLPPGIPGEHPMGPWRRGLPLLPRTAFSLHPSPALAVRGQEQVVPGAPM